MKKYSGKFLTIEGIEGVGKTTAMNYIQAYLIAHQKKFILTREPGGTAIAERIRQILLIPSNEEIVQPETELLLMFASRAQHVAHKILPALKAGQHVISDRYVDASYAYQGGGRQIELAQIALLDQWTTHNLQPDMTILLDAPVPVGLARAKNRGPQDRIEQEKAEFFERVRAVYLARAKQCAERFRIIDATQSLALVHAELNIILGELFHDG